MSTGESKQSYTVEDIKAELRHAVRQLGELTRSDVAYEDFSKTVLSKLISLTGAHGALLWHLLPTGSVQPAQQVLAPNLSLDLDAGRHREVVAGIAHNQSTECIDSRTLATSEAVDPAATCLLMLTPVLDRRRQSIGVLELLQRNNVTAAAREGYIKFLVKMAELFQRWHEHHDLQRLSQSADVHSTTLEFVTEVHRSIDFKETVYAIANESRRLLNCDRVSVAKWTGNACKVLAISSQDRFDNRANVVRKLGSLATACVRSDTTLWITGETAGLPPEIVRRINEYLDESHCRTLAVIPLHKQTTVEANLEFQPRRRTRPRKLGALIIEFFQVDVAQDQVAEPVRLIKEHAQISAANALEHQQIFLRPLWKRLGDLTAFLFRDHFAKTMTALGALTLFTLFLIFFPSELKMRVPGVMQPAERRNIFAMTEGIIEAIHVDQGDQVTKGDLLIELVNPDLDIAIEEARGQHKVVSQKIMEVNTRLSREKQLAEDDAISLWGQRDQLSEQKTNLEKQLQLMEKKLALQKITSPINGTVVTWDARKRLTDLPVTAGQFVLAVGDFKGRWQAELRVPQNQVGYVVAAMNNNDGPPLDVDFRVSTNPNVLVHGKLIRLADRTDPGQSGVPEFRAIVEADTSELSDLRPGAGLTAKIHCGQRATGFVWFYQIIDFLRTRVFF
jgi:multidrug efflux pump subunit AcrA (membrane-fusion protein)